MRNITGLIFTTTILTATMFTLGFASDGAAVLIDYPGIAVVLDEKEIPVAGRDSIPVEPGGHRITLYFPASGDLWLPPIMSRSFALKENERLVISEESIRYLYIMTTPAGAETYLDDQVLGGTPLAISILPTDRTIRLKKAGYRESLDELEWIRDRSSTLNRVLAPLISAGDGAGREMNARTEQRPWPDWIPYTTLTGFITSTALGFYYKSRSDEMYDEYLRTSSREDMNQLFDRANTLDGRARIFWITGQVALSATIYLFIRNYRIRSIERPLPSLGLGVSGNRAGGVCLTITFSREAGAER